MSCFVFQDKSTIEIEDELGFCFRRDEVVRFSGKHYIVLAVLHDCILNVGGCAARIGSEVHLGELTYSPPGLWIKEEPEHEEKEA